MQKKQLIPFVCVCIVFVVFVTLTFVGVKQEWDMNLQWVFRIIAISSCAIEFILLIRIAKSLSNINKK